MSGARTRMSARWSGLASLAVLAALVLSLALAATASASTVTFANAAPITIPDSGAGAPYPSTIDVSGLTRTVTDVNIVLAGFSHTFPDDVDVLLVGPGGQTCVLMADTGGGSDVAGCDLTFDDAAASGLPDSSQIVPGTYRPTVFGTGFNGPSPAPAGPYGATLAGFNGVGPNGTWQLFVLDDLGMDAGAISGGWSLVISVDDTAPVTTADVSPTPDAGWNNSDATVTLNATDSETGVAGTEYSLDGASYTPGTTLTISTEGTHTVDYRSTDNAGNVETPQRVAVKIDRTGPTTTDDVPAGWQSTSPFAVTLTPHDGAGCGTSGGLARTEYKIDDASSWSVGISAAVTGDGTHTVTYRSTDALGNVGPDGSCTVKIDATAPSFAALPNDSAWHMEPVTLTLTPVAGISGLASVEYQLGHGAWTELAKTGDAYTLTVSTEGKTLVRYRATSVAGLRSAVGNHTVKFDGGAPTLRLGSRAMHIWTRSGDRQRLKLLWNDAAGTRALLRVRVTQYGSERQQDFSLTLKRRGRWQVVSLPWRPDAPGRYQLHLTLFDPADRNCLASAGVVAHP